MLKKLFIAKLIIKITKTIKNIETMSDEYTALLESMGINRNVKAQFDIESKEFQLQKQKTNRLHKE